MYRERKFVQNFKIQWKICLNIAFVFVFFGCTIGETQSIKEDIRLKAISIPEGINLHFDNIPTDTIWVYIEYNDWGGKDSPSNYYDGTTNYAYIKDVQEIERLKKTHSLTLPFVQPGHKYEIGVVFFLTKEGETQTQDNMPIILVTECISDNGIYLQEYMDLSFNETQTSVALFSKPQFSSEVQFAPVDISYRMTLLYSMTENGFSTISYNDTIFKESIFDNVLTWNFEPKMSDYIKEGNQIKNSVNYPAYFTARSNVIYDNITWSVEIAKSKEFNYSY